LTGSYLGAATQAGGLPPGIPRIIPNPLDNSLLIQATPQNYASVLKLLNQLDVAPRQVLLEAKIYEVSLTGAFASGVSAFLQSRNASGTGAATLPAKKLLGSLAEGITSLTAGTLVGNSRELLAFVSLQETTGRTKVISAPSIIATDSIAASINVGTEVPTLSSQAVTGVQVGGSSAFANTISDRQSGVTLQILARVTPGGIVTLMINQEVSSPIPPSGGGIQSPSFAKRTIQTQVTVEDGDTIAIGGIMNESHTESTNGIPGLQHIPWIGGVFGSHSTSKEKTELIVFMTPRVIYDTNEIKEASEELKGRLKRLAKIVKE
jgi:general secretion pathway protein D